MQDSSKLISTQIEREIPQFIRMEYPNFVAFVVYYYEWMEKQGAPYHFIANTLNFADVDRTSLELLDIFGRNFLQPLPDIIYDNNNIATLVKNINQYYSARGAEKSFQFLFRLFDYQQDEEQDLEFYYPSYDMLRVSDGKWVNEKTLKIIDPPGLETIMSWESGEITGETSGAKAVIDEVKVYESTSGVSIAEIFLLEMDIINTPQKFIVGEDISVVIFNEDTLLEENLSHIATTENVFYQVQITDPGKFYIPDQRVKVINSGDGEDARVVINYTGKGTVTGFTVLDGGSDYVVGDKVYTQGDTFGSGAYGKVSSVGIGGDITSVELIFGGHDYRYSQGVVIDSLEGSHAEIILDSDDIGTVESLTIRDFGINYLTSESTIVFNTAMRIYGVSGDMFIGEEIIGGTSGAEGIVEYWDRDTGVLSVNVTSGTFEALEEITGQRYGGTANIHDISLATGELVEGCLCEYDGRYINLDGHVSSLKYIQDSYFYQMFSYMLKTTRDKEEWKDYIKHVHPAGLIGFSYKDVVSQYFNESYGGFISPHLDTAEFYKFRWDSQHFDGDFTQDFGLTQIKQYKDVVIDDVININNNIINKTGYCYGSEITIS